MQTSKATLRTYGWLYGLLKPEFYWWSTVVMLRKATMAIVSVFMAPFSLVLQAVCTIIVAVLAFVLHEVCEPYSLAWLNRLETASLATIILTMAGGVLLNDTTLSASAGQWTSILIVLINVAFIAVPG